MDFLVVLQGLADIDHTQLLIILPKYWNNYSVDLHKSHRQLIKLLPAPNHKPSPKPIHKHALSCVLINWSKSSDDPSNCVAIRCDHFSFEVVWKIRMEDGKQAIKEIQFEFHALEVVIEDLKEIFFHDAAENGIWAWRHLGFEKHVTSEVVHALTVGHFRVLSRIKDQEFLEFFMRQLINMQVQWPIDIQYDNLFHLILFLLLHDTVNSFEILLDWQGVADPAPLLAQQNWQFVNNVIMNFRETFAAKSQGNLRLVEETSFSYYF